MDEPDVQTSHRGYEWATEALSDWVMSDLVVRDAAQDVIRMHAGARAEFWLATFLWNVLFGAGLPFLDNTNYVRRLNGNLGAVTKPNFVHVDFEAIRLRLARRKAEGNSV
jgi:hypothetical protein